MTDATAAQISPAALDRWNAISGEAEIRLRLTRADLDNLLLALRTLAIGQGELAAALAAHTNQDMDGCIEAMMRASELARSSFGRVNALIGAVMASAEPIGAPPVPGGA